MVESNTMRRGGPMLLLRGSFLGDGYTENAPIIDSLGYFSEPRCLRQLVHLPLRSSSHDPGTELAMAGKCPRYHFELRMKRLPGINQEAAGFDHIGQAPE